MHVASLNIGSHLSIAGGLHEALLRARRYKFTTVQLFVANQRQWRHPPLTAEDVDRFRLARRKTGLEPVVAHGSYLVNPAAVDSEIYRKSRQALADEFERCRKLGIDYLVIHPGSHGGRGVEKGLARVVRTINRLFEKVPVDSCKLLLETTAGQGNCLGERFEHLAWIIQNVEQSQRLGVCLDTCHIFAAGYDFQTENAFRAMLAEFNDIIGLGRLKVIHVNDSQKEQGSRVDRHEHIGKGCIGKEGFRHFVRSARLRHLPFIMETPKGKSPGGRDYDRLNAATLRRLAKYTNRA